MDTYQFKALSEIVFNALTERSSNTFIFADRGVFSWSFESGIPHKSQENQEQSTVKPFVLIFFGPLINGFISKSISKLCYVLDYKKWVHIYLGHAR